MDNGSKATKQVTYTSIHSPRDLCIDFAAANKSNIAHCFSHIYKNRASGAGHFGWSNSAQYPPTHATDPGRLWSGKWGRKYNGGLLVSAVPFAGSLVFLRDLRAHQPTFCV